MAIDILIKLCGGFWSVKDKCQKYKNVFLKKSLLFIYNQYLIKRGSYVGLDAFIKSPPLLPHGILGIFISPKAKIGHNCIMYQHVTVGENVLTDSPKMGAPIIGDNCYIGAGAKIIGKVVIGNNVRIGANCVVVTDIPDNSIVVPQKARVIQREKLINRQYTYKNNGFFYYEKGNWIAESNKEILNKLEK
ncbi:serine O-acetyltransferase [Bacillus sp. BK006]|nr:serine O-acetyltransferase [Bacillus sp. BK006]